MRRIARCLLGVTAFFLAATGTARAQNYPDFSNTTGLNLVGSATQVGNVLQLTSATQNLAGAFWYTTPVKVSGGFDTTFRFRMSNFDTSFGGADGMAFVIQNSPQGTAALGSIGSGLGY